MVLFRLIIHIFRVYFSPNFIVILIIIIYQIRGPTLKLSLCCKLITVVTSLDELIT
jgi:hypothetical protein